MISKNLNTGPVSGKKQSNVIKEPCLLVDFAEFRSSEVAVWSSFESSDSSSDLFFFFPELSLSCS